MPLRLNLLDAKDREWLEKRGIDLKSLFLDRSMLINEYSGEKRSYDDSNEKKTKRSKYRNTIIEAEGVKWSSKYEYECWQQLKDLRDKGLIKNLKRQVTVKFEHNGVVLWTTRPDFYFEVDIDEDQKFPVYADAKNSFTANTRSFKTGQKFFRAFYNTEMLVFLKDKNSNIEQMIKQLRV